MDDVTALRARLAQLSGAARAATLLELGRALSERCRRAGPADPAGPADLTAAIDACEEALRSGQLPPGPGALARLMLGQLYLGRAAVRLRSSGAAGELRPAAGSDIEDAVRCLREVRDGPPAATGTAAAVEHLLTAAEALQAIRPGHGVDGGRMTGVMAMLQQVERELPAFVAAGVGVAPSAPVAAGPPGRPATVHDPRSRAAPVPGAVPAVAGVGLGAARRAARVRLAGLSGDRHGEPWTQVLRLLGAGPADLPVGELDAFVGAATNAVDVATREEAPGAGLDLLLLAAALCLRGRSDDGGWGAGAAYETSGDLRTGARHLRAAAERIPPAHPAAGAVVEAFGSFLDGTRPLCGPGADVAAALGGYAAAVAGPTGVVTALGLLCRSITALRDGGAVHADAFVRAVEAVPAGHPLCPLLGRAGVHLRLAEAVRSGDHARVRAAAAAEPSPLAAVLVALDGDDAAALRSAAGDLPATHPLEAAIAGAVLLQQDDLDGAIAVLRPAANALDAADADDAAGTGGVGGGLRDRTWWRLATAHRRRGMAGDAEQCRAAGLAALRGAGQDAAWAACFAGWMLADGRAAEAFTALEA
ncbi:hypothetical protein AB0K00_51600, partial [Dactylosporangium sp. NPDC049525]|uniref:hypothetical protein n=1 Tax=Dactylosporangium sp. NPDC049525 TaxID=3154730 RepID=UPI0034137982